MGSAEFGGLNRLCKSFGMLVCTNFVSDRPTFDANEALASCSYSERLACSAPLRARLRDVEVQFPGRGRAPTCMHADRSVTSKKQKTQCESNGL